MKINKYLLLTISALSLCACGSEETPHANDDEQKVCQHVDSNHDGACDKCGETGLKVIHKDSDPTDHICDVCGKKLSDHIDESPIDHLCDYCGYSFGSCKDENHDGTCDICGKKGLTVTHVDEDKNGLCDVCATVVPIEFNVNFKHESEKWDEVIDQMIAYPNGNSCKYAVPSMEGSKGYYAYFENIETTTGSGDYVLTTIVEIRGVDSDTAIDDYKYLLQTNGFYFGSSDYAYLKLGAEGNLIVQYSIIPTKYYDILELLIYSAKTRDVDWPTQDLITYIGRDLPHFECESYESYINVYDFSFSIWMHNTGATGITEYGKILVEAGYKLTSKTGDSDYYESEDGFVTVRVTPSYDEYNEESLYVLVENKWPHIAVIAMIGEEIPAYTSKDMEYTYLDLDKDEKYETLAIYYDNTGVSDYSKVCEQFIKDGWTLNEQDSSEYFSYFTKYVNNVKKTIRVIYSDTINSICVAISE